MHQSILTPIHQAGGASFASVGGPLVLSFTDVPAEYAAARDGAALLDQTDRGAVELSGPDAQSFLHRLSANEVRKLSAGQGNANLMLDAKGKVRFCFDVSVERDRLRLSTQPGEAKRIVDALEIYHFAEKLDLAEVSDRHAPIAIAGPRAVELARAVLGAFEQPADFATIELAHDGASVRVTARPTAGLAGLRIDAGPERAPTLWRRLIDAGAQPIGRIVYDILRVEHAVAEPGVDIDETVYPQEARLEHAFSLDKGCYTGQEVVAKIETYGGLNKRMTQLRVSSDDPIALGTRLYRRDDGEWRDLGVVTSWAYSFALDTGAVLAYVKRRHQAEGVEFRVGDGPLTASVIDRIR